jgi:phosphatidylserine decarboxylase
MLMRIPLTKYGWPQVVILPAVMLLIMVLLAYGAHSTTPEWLVWTVEIILFVVFIWTLSFFRDPERTIPQDREVLLAPADGKITDIATVDENEFIKGKSLRVGIFLNIFDVHINRSPCMAKVEKITHREGKYLNALKLESGRVNESNDLWLTRLEPPFDKLIVRQISGAIARRIVCRVNEGEELAGGQRFGMIKFGSRTELYVPMPRTYFENDKSDSSQSSIDKTTAEYNSRTIAQNRCGVKCLVKTGDKVKAGLTPIIRYV